MLNILGIIIIILIFLLNSDLYSCSKLMISWLY